MSALRRRILRAFGRFQRPVAWAMLALSVAAFISIVSTIWKVQDPVLTAFVALSLIWDGWSAVQEVENDLDSEASADGA